MAAQLSIVSRKLILVVHEIGIAAIDEIGTVLWSYAKDIIEDCVVDEERVRLDFMDEPSVTLSLFAGQPIR